MSGDDAISGLAFLWPIVKARDWDRLGELYAWDVVDHERFEGQPPGLAGVEWRYRNLETAFPDFSYQPLALFADGDFVTLVTDLCGTHTGVWQGHAPTGRTFSIRVIQLTKFAHGLAVERWVGADWLGLLQQLGLV